MRKSTPQRSHHRRPGEVAALRAASRALVERRTFGDTARAVLEPCKTILRAGAGLVATRAEAAEGFRVAVVDAGGADLGSAAGLPAPLRRLTARAVRGGRAVFGNRLSQAPGSAPPGTRRAVGSALLAPIVIDGETAGLLGLIDKPGGFSTADCRLAEVFAELVAAAMVRSRRIGHLETGRTAREIEMGEAAAEVSPATAVSSPASVAAENAVLFEQMQASTVRLQSLSRRLVEAQENERRHIARELHDEAGQALASLRFGLRVLEREIEAGGDVAGQVAELVQRTDSVIDGLHRLAADLRPATLDHLGLAAALRQYARSAAAKYGLTVRFKARGLTGERLPSAVETALYRVVQEAMTNLVRHARATRVDVLVERRDGRVLVMVEDDGRGFEVDRVEHGEHFGLLGLRERAEALGGELTVESAPGKGTTVVVQVPCDDPNPDR